jgi:hypothetical protein
MKKLLVIFLSLCFVVPAFAEGVRAVDNDAWLDHLGQMQIIRQQILSLVTKENPTAEDKAVLENLKADFADQKAKWDNYLVDVSQNQEAPKAIEVKPDTQGKTCGSKCKDGDCKGKRKHKKHWKKSCKSCDKDCSGKCGDCKVKGCDRKDCKCRKHVKKEIKPCSKGKECCQVTGKECTDPNCGSHKKAAKCGRKNWAQHVCGDQCKNGCKFAKKDSCDTPKKTVEPCSKGKDCCQVTGKECTDPDCGSHKKAKKHGKKCWAQHVCGEQCKDGCKFAKKECCGSAMCKEVGHCIRDSKKADDCCKASGKKGCCD